jgi:hypothetical protein
MGALGVSAPYIVYYTVTCVRVYIHTNMASHIYMYVWPLCCIYTFGIQNQLSHEGVYILFATSCFCLFPFCVVLAKVHIVNQFVIV